MGYGVSAKRRFCSANLITLLHHLYRLGLGDRVQPTQAAGAGRDHRVGRQLQTVFGRDSIGSLGGRLEVENATVGVKQIDDPATLTPAISPCTVCSIARSCTGAAASVT
jgi:hypothetical protein